MPGACKAESDADRRIFAENSDGNDTTAVPVEIEET